MSRANHQVVVVAFEGFQSLDLTGPVEVLRTASRLGARPPYEVRIATPRGEPARSESGITITADASLASLARKRERIGTLIAVGGDGTRTARDDTRFIRDLAAVAARSDRVASVCTGALLLAEAGLLDGYEATTHWARCEHFAQRHPQVTVHPRPHLRA